MRLCGTVRSFRTALPPRVVTNLARLTSPSCLPFQRDGRFRGKRARPARAAGLGVPSPARRMHIRLRGAVLPNPSRLTGFRSPSPPNSAAHGISGGVRRASPASSLAPARTSAESRAPHRRHAARSVAAGYRGIVSLASRRADARSPAAARAQLAIAAESALPHEVSFSLATTAGCTARGGRPGTHESHVCRCGKAGDAPVRLGNARADAKAETQIYLAHALPAGPANCGSGVTGLKPNACLVKSAFATEASRCVRKAEHSSTK